MNNKVIRFFEIPVNDLSRATEFYENVFDTKLEPMKVNNTDIAMFCADENQTHGALVQGESYVPSQQGALVYLNGGDNMQLLIDRIPKFGGKIIMNKTELKGHGFVGRFIDTEGNKVALHSVR